MNYFAHARVATSLKPDALFVLGAMLPDFAHMLGARIRAIDHPELGAGAALHHRTDAVFHVSRSFGRLVRDGIQALDEAGLRRGPSRGAAHVGVELLLDGALLGAPACDDAYLAALGAAPELSDAIAWSRPDATVRWRKLIARLRDLGLPTAYRDPARVAQRVVRALDARPRLRLDASERACVEPWLVAIQPSVRSAAPDLLAETLAAL